MDEDFVSFKSLEKKIEIEFLSENGDCGMEIKNMNQDDKTQWKCFAGLMDAEDAVNIKLPETDKKIYKLSSVMDASDDWNVLKGWLKLQNIDPKSFIINLIRTIPFTSSDQHGVRAIFCRQPECNNSVQRKFSKYKI